ncbi:dehydrogenase/reductase SDR family member FEY-like isoform X2 [Magnolia sinica]|uniref:dehydrogenase/reductase SDR family member FEY-like isoform X2 n=1 Tax=Magnolia sinica TaxID=86752 RepID=UPI002657DD0F|nr:dehydrogenase/reductase SDR family member FEY-like isoform X2 [Magnolia sinica]
MGSSSTTATTTTTTTTTTEKKGLGWMEWLRGWFYVIYEMLFQRITASHIPNPLDLSPLPDLTCIVTGSTSGIGLEIARQLAESGAHVVMAVRNPKAAHDLIQKWQNEWSGIGAPLNVELPYSEPQRFSKDGYEEHMQVNHLAPALLSILLLPSLIRGSPSRIVNMNSIMHAVGFVDTEDMNVISGKRKYTSLVGYSSSKLAQVMFNSIFHKRIPAEAGVSVMCVSPGIVQTNVARDLPKIVQAAYHLIPYFLFSAQEGSRSALFAATDPQVPEYCGVLKADEWPVCAYISHDCRPMNASEEAHNVATSQMVWVKTLEMIGLPLDAVEKLIEGEQVQCRYGVDG